MDSFVQQSSKHSTKANVCPAGRCWEPKSQETKCTLDSPKHSKPCCFQLPDLHMLILQVPKLIPLGICDEHNLQNQTYFTEIQDKTCNDFSQSIVVLQLSFLMCHLHCCYWQPKFPQLFQAAAEFSLFWVWITISSALHPCLWALLTLISQLNLPSSCFKGQLQRTNFIWLGSWHCTSMKQPPVLSKRKRFWLSCQRIICFWLYWFAKRPFGQIIGSFMKRTGTVNLSEIFFFSLLGMNLILTHFY